MGMHLGSPYLVCLLSVLLRRQLCTQGIRLHLQHLVLLIQLVMQLVVDTSREVEVFLSAARRNGWAVQKLRATLAVV